MFTSFYVFIVSVCLAAGANFSGEVLEAVAAGLGLADGVCLAVGVKWYSCSCTAACFHIIAVLPRPRLNVRGGRNSLINASYSFRQAQLFPFPLVHVHLQLCFV